MVKSRIKLFLSMIMAFSLLLVVACSNENTDSDADSNGLEEGESNTVEPEEGTEDATTLSLWTFVAYHQDHFEYMVERWNEENPNEQIKLEMTNYPFEEMHNKLLIALQSGVGAPDFANIEIKQWSKFLQGSEEDISLEPLNDMVEPILDNAVEARFTNYSKDGNYYGIPTQVAATVMYYNKEMMNEAEVDPMSIETWDDFVEAGLKVKDATGKPMTTVESADTWTFWPIISQRGSDLIDEAGNVIVDNEINTETLQFLSDMVHEHEIAIPAPGGNHSAEEFFGFFSDGGAASVMMPAWYMSRFRDYMPDMAGNIEIAPMPAWEKGGARSAGMGGTGTALTNQSEHKDLAKRFLEYAKLSEEGSIALWTILGSEPPRWDVWDKPEMSEDNEFTELFGNDIFEKLSTIRDDINPINITDDSSRAIDLVSNQLLYNVIREGQDVEEGIKKVADEIRDSQ
ncbi:extracellular solute-binding protein [Gracilibacillus salitolerans]|uniref:Extracellular solute-binding protein n=1 Tax=Gracilibacillus salitolerans TaxID=2663022 RepID=A0A5Q2TMQ2_9BACI|nr:sugar ABC transporter substrate-binding protein [Gracilibacillus salitolerans]QGH35985.1 extracellular solute-binding protein [Gracilibacillus salitolerans]